MTGISSSQGVQANWKVAAGDDRVTQQEADAIITNAKLEGVTGTEVKEADAVLANVKSALANNGNPEDGLHVALDTLAGGGSLGDAVGRGVSTAVTGAQLQQQQAQAQRIADELHRVRDDQGFLTNLWVDFKGWYNSTFN